jgi:hypothetical protein
MHVAMDYWRCCVPGTFGLGKMRLYLNRRVSE